MIDKNNIQDFENRFTSRTIKFSSVNAFPSIQVSNDFAQAEILLYGSHVLSFIPKGSRDVLWLSSKSKMTPGKAIRGGIPICWPWFGPLATPAHGIARILEWKLEDIYSEKDGSDTLMLSLDCSDSNGLRVQSKINVGAALSFSLSTENVGHEDYSLTSALHAYFSVSEIEKVQVKGLDKEPYFDKVANASGFNKGELCFHAETDAVFDQTQASVIIQDRDWKRSIRLEKSGSKSTVIWNPWIEKSKSMDDFPDQGYRNMICVEAANVGADARVLQPGEKHTLFARIVEE